MKICVLEHPRIPSEHRFNEIANTPLWSCLMAGYAAASLREKGHEVELVDALGKGWNFARTLEQVLDGRWGALFVHAVYFWEHTGALFRFLEDLRKGGFRGHVCLFGFFPTLACSALLDECHAVDSVAVGECEHTVVELAHRLARGEPWREVRGLAWRDPHLRVCTAGVRAPDPNPDRFPFPLRNLGSEAPAGVLASRGCYNQCTFCPVPVYYNQGPLWRGRTPENVFREMADLSGRGIREFYFLDANFVGPGPEGKRRIRDLARLLRPLGIAFGMETRSDDLEPFLLEDLVNAGLQSLLIGIESGSPRSLRRLGKGNLAGTAARAVALCREVGIDPEIGFIMFEPDATLEDIRWNLDFLHRNALLDRLDRTANLLYHRQIVLMGTPGYRFYRRRKRLVPKGPLGFEGAVRYGDRRVEWLADAAAGLCLYVLKQMGEESSPLYWRRGDAELSLFSNINGYLVERFERLMEEAEAGKKLPPADLRVQELTNALEERIRRFKAGPGPSGSAGSSREGEVPSRDRFVPSGRPLGP